MREVFEPQRNEGSEQFGILAYDKDLMIYKGSLGLLG
jgi:hypothetical protein